jgi:hypothetical protein
LSTDGDKKLFILAENAAGRTVVGMKSQFLRYLKKVNFANVIINVPH